MAKVVSQSVNRIWKEFETSGDGLMQFDEAKVFLKEILGDVLE